MASLEISGASTIANEQVSVVGRATPPVQLAGGAMQRSASQRGVTRGHITPTSPHDNMTPVQQSQPVRAASMRSNPKLKVLVRSHAMREETSPPREPTPPHCISIITSPPPSSPIHCTSPTAQPITHCRRSPNRSLLSPTTPSSPTLVAHSPKHLPTTPSSPSQQELRYTSTVRTQMNGENNSSPCECFNNVCTKCKNNNSKETINNNVIVNTLSVRGGGSGSKRVLRHQGSSQGSFEGGVISATPSPCLSRDSSTEQYTDCTGIDLQQFIIDTLNKNAKDRVMMLKIEQELVSLAKDKTKSHYKFPSMSSYQRMLVHRCAAYFGMDHNIETSGKCVIVNKTRNTRIPETRFREHVREDLLFPEEPRRSILKRDSNSFEDCHYKSPDRHLGLENRRSKSFEEREEEYEKARRRIFKDGTLQDCDSQEEFSWAEMPWPEADSAKIRLLPPEQPILKNRLLKVQSVDGRSEPLRPCVAKSYSFGGYGGSVSVLSRGDSVTSTHSAGPRLLTKQDSSTSTISWRLSPSSSGYKTQSQRSDSVTPSPTATPHQLSSASSGKNSMEEGIGGYKNQLHENITDMGDYDDKAIGYKTLEEGPLSPTSEEICLQGSYKTHDPTFAQHRSYKNQSDECVISNMEVGSFNDKEIGYKSLEGGAINETAYLEQRNYKNLSRENVSSSPPAVEERVGRYKEENVEGEEIPIREIGGAKEERGGDKKEVVWAVTDMGSVPKGSVLINPQTGQPFTNQDGTIYHFDPSNPPCFSKPSPPTPVKHVSPPRKSPIKEPLPSPKKTKTNKSTSPAKTVKITAVTNSATSPSLPEPPTNQRETGGGTYHAIGQQAMESVANYQVYPNGFGGDVMYQQMVYTPYGVQQYENRPESVPADLSGYFMNMSISDPNNCNSQPIGYAPSNNYWNQQPITYYQHTTSQPVPNNQRYPVQIAQPQPPFVSSPYHPPNYLPTTPPTQEILQYPPPVHLMYGPSPSSAPPTAPPPANPLYLPSPAPANPHALVYAQTPPLYAAQTGSAYPMTQQYATGQYGFDAARKQNQGKGRGCRFQSGGSSAGSSSPVIGGYFGGGGYRQTPPETPPGMGFPGNYVQQSMIFRPMSSNIRASPPVNVRSSRSPTPAPEFPSVAAIERNQRFPTMAPTICLPFTIIPGRGSGPMYKQQAYRQTHTVSQGHNQTPTHQQQEQHTANNRHSASASSLPCASHKQRKTRSKVPALPPSGRQSNQSISTSRF